MDTTTLIELAYAPPIPYMALLLQGGCAVEAHDHYQKRSLRNRCLIAGPEGALLLSIPVRRMADSRYYCEMGMDPSRDWQRHQWQSLTSCYRSSPYFEYYEDRLRPFYHDEFSSLFELNKALLSALLDTIAPGQELHFTGAYVREPAVWDLRDRLRVHNFSALPGSYSSPVYAQVFQDRHGFLPDLSIYDMLFNCGPRTAEMLHAALT